MDFKILTAGDSAVTLNFGAEISPRINAAVHAAQRALEQADIAGVMEYVPAYCSLTVFYDPLRLEYGELCTRLHTVLDEARAAQQVASSRLIEIPVLYGGKYGPDLENVCMHTGLEPGELIARHSSPDYLIYMLGFLPGFAYLGGMPAELSTPRLAAPRERIEPGSVGIAGGQTGIYPLASPGGWQIIGRTPLKVYDPGREEPILYRAGDRLRFVPIDEKEFLRIEGLVKAGIEPEVRTL